MLSRLSHRTLCVLAGSIWMLAGINLLVLGARFFAQSLEMTAPLNQPLIRAISGWIPQREWAVQFLAMVGMAIGLMKGKVILRKAARREVQRITQLPDRVSIFQLYSKRAVIILALMICLGFSLRFLQVPLDVRGMVDIAVGTALIFGSFSYFRLEGAVTATSKT